MKPGAIAVVTGGAGFIGSHMVDALLERGWRVRALDDLSTGRQANLAAHRRDPRFAFEERDVRRLADDDPLFAGAEAVFHFAGLGALVPSIERPTDYMDVNVMGTVRVLEAARRIGNPRFVYAASSSCYGLAAVPIREDHPIQPQYPYALSKYLGECAVLHWRQVYGLAAASLRVFNAYGPRAQAKNHYGAVFGVFLRQKLAGRPFTVIGDGTQRRDFVYVTDVAEAFLRAASPEADGEIFNVGAGNPQTVNRLVELLGGPQVVIPKRPGEPECTWADISKIGARIGWRPTVSFEDGVGRLLTRIDEWRDAPLWDPASIAEATRPWFAALAGDRG